MTGSAVYLTVAISVTDYKVDAVNWPGTSEQMFSAVTETDTCPTRTSVLALSVVCAMLLVIYICTMFYFCMRKVILQNQKVSFIREWVNKTGIFYFGLPGIVIEERHDF